MITNLILSTVLLLIAVFSAMWISKQYTNKLWTSLTVIMMFVILGIFFTTYGMRYYKLQRDAYRAYVWTLMETPENDPGLVDDNSEKLEV